MDREIVDFLDAVRRTKIIKIIEGEPVEFVAIDSPDIHLAEALLSTQNVAERQLSSGNVLQFTRPVK